MMCGLLPKECIIMLCLPWLQARYMLAGMTYLCFNLELFYVYVATSAECHHFTQAKTNLCAKVSEVVEYMGAIRAKASR